MNTQLTLANGYNTQRMIFSEPQVGSIGVIKYKRINLTTRNDDGSTGELVLPTSEVFSFGVSENRSQTGELNGYVLPLCLWSRDGPTPDEKTWIETFNNIIDRCKKFLIETKDELGKPDLIMSDLRKLNPLYYKKGDDGKIVQGKGPTLYAKLISRQKKTKKDEKSQEKSEPKELEIQT